RSALNSRLVVVSVTPLACCLAASVAGSVRIAMTSVRLGWPVAPDPVPPPDGASPARGAVAGAQATPRRKSSATVNAGDMSFMGVPLLDQSLTGDATLSRSGPHREHLTMPRVNNAA